MYRVFHATPKGMSKMQADKLREGLHAALRAAIPEEIGIEIVNAKDEFDLSFPNYRNYASWTEYVGAGFDAIDATPTYSCYAFPIQQIGKGNMSIAKHALAADRMVIYRTREGKWVRGTGVKTVDETDWKAGWLIE